MKIDIQKSVKLLLVMLLCISGSLAFAQGTKAVTGKVLSSADRSGLPGVNVIVKGTTLGTITDRDGSFSLNVPDLNGVLVFSFIGYEASEVRINGRTSFDVNLNEDVRALSQVVVVAYGTQERRDLTGSISKVTAEDIANVPIVSADALLQGRAAGVVVTNNSGAPGSGVSVRIRGTGSLNASNEPLYVVDGVPITSQPFGNQLARGGSISPIADINPNDIESMEILKDAAATSIYGARASNGVVLITTKRGRKGPSRLSFNTYTGITIAPPKLPLLTGSEMKTTMLEGSSNFNPTGWFTDFPHLLDDPTRADYHLYKYETDWQDLVRQQGVIRDFNVSLRGGDEKTTYAISPGYTTQKGTIVGSGYERFTTTINVDHKISDKFTIGNSLRVSRSRIDRIEEGNSFDSNPYHVAMIKMPFLSPWRVDQNLGSPNYGNELVGAYSFWDFQDRSNPLLLANNFKNYQFNNRAIGNVYVSYNILPGLNFRTNFGVDFYGLKESRFAPEGMRYMQRQAYEQWSQDLTWINENIFTYNKVFNEVHNFSALAGYTNQRSKFERINGSTDRMIDNTIETLNAGPNFRSIGSGVSEWGITSLIGRLTYIYNDKYSLSANIRRDGSSKFGEDNRWATFPAISGYWRLSSEEFMQPVAHVVSDLKIRASYGQTGNQDIPQGAALTLYGVGASYSGDAGIAQTSLAATGLGWETTTQTNIGVDFSILNNRVSIIADAYSNYTRDLLVRAPLPNTSGFGFKWDNVGDIKNQGLELHITGRILDGTGLKWTADFNISKQTNKIMRLLNEEDLIIQRDGFVGIARVGESLGTFFGWVAEGVYASDSDNQSELRNANGYLFKGGDVIFKDVNNDNRIDELDRVPIGTALPDFFGGLTNNFSYKGFDLNVFLQYEYGKDVMNATRQALSRTGGSDNTLTSTLRRWRQQGDITDMPIARRSDGNFADNNRQSTRWLEDGSYLRVKTVMLGYNIPKAFFKDRISNARIYVAANNLVTFTKYLGQDPEFAQPENPILNGIDYFNYPQSRVYTMGLNVTF